MSAPDSSTYVDIAGAAAELVTSTKFVRARIADGSLPAVRLKGSPLIRIKRTDLEALGLPMPTDVESA